MKEPEIVRVRLDKWLWAARFFKTRALAQAAISGGKVHYAGKRVKPSHEVKIGAELTLQLGYDTRQVTVKALSDRRGSASQAVGLYEESEASLLQRQQAAAVRRQQAVQSSIKPDKRQRRQLHQFVRQRNAHKDDQ